MTEESEDTQHDLKYYEREKVKLINLNRARNTMYAAMDDMWHNNLKLPAQLTGSEGFHQVTPTEPSDSIQTARRLLSTVEPKITFHPLDDDIDTRERANVIESALLWHFQRASRRSVGNLVSDIVLSATLYDSIDAFVEYIPWQNEISKQVTGKSWETSGDYAITIFNPQDVYVNRTNRGVRSVLLYVEMTPDDVIDTWGDLAEEIIEEYAQSKGGDKEWPETVFYCDRWDKTDRVVWLEFSRDAVTIEEKNVIIRAPHKLPFIPWVNRAGGSAIDKKPEYQRRPLLTSVYQAKSWSSVAIMESLLVTEAIKTGAAPLTVSKTNNGKSPKIDYTQIGGNVPLQLNEDLQPMQKPQLDHRLAELTDRLEHRMGSSTLPSVLGDPSFSAGTAFASVNATLRAASNALDPARSLSENALADIFTLELMWLIHTKKPLYAYNHSDKRSESYGRQLKVDPKQLEPTDIYITVKLSANLPLDKISEINAVSLLMDKFGISKEQALEMLDFINAGSLIEQGAQEALTSAEVQNALMLIQAQGQAEAKRIMDAQQLETQQAQMEMQMQAQQQQMAAQQPQQDPNAQMMQQPDQSQQPGAIPGDLAMAQQQAVARASANISPDQAASELANLTGNMQGMASDPSMGGQSPSGALPGALTREAKTKRTKGGTPIQGA